MKVKPVEAGAVIRLNPVQAKPPRDVEAGQPTPTAQLRKEDQANLEKELERSTRQMNAISEILGQRYQFSIDKTTNQLVVKVVDTFTGRVVKQMPPEEMLELAAQMRYMVGIFMDQLV